MIDHQSPNTLIALCGLPRSGKTTYAKGTGFPVVNPDSIRLAIHGHRYIMNAEVFVWAIAQTMTRALFLAGHTTVVLDATNMTRKRRDEWRSSDWTTYWKAIDTNKDTCLCRAIAANDLEIIPVIERMAASAEPLGEDELRWL